MMHSAEKTFYSASIESSVCSFCKDSRLATTRDNHRNGDEMLCPWNTRNTFQLLTGVYSEQYGLQNDSIYAEIRLEASSKCIQYFRVDHMIILENLCSNLLIWSMIWRFSCFLLIRRIQRHRYLYNLLRTKIIKISRTHLRWNKVFHLTKRSKRLPSSIAWRLLCTSPFHSFHGLPVSSFLKWLELQCWCDNLHYIIYLHQKWGQFEGKLAQSVIFSVTILYTLISLIFALQKTPKPTQTFPAERRDEIIVRTTVRLHSLRRQDINQVPSSETVWDIENNQTS